MAAVLVLEPIFEADLPAEQYAYRRDRSALDAVKQPLAKPPASSLRSACRFEIGTNCVGSVKSRGHFGDLPDRAQATMPEGWKKMADKVFQGIIQFRKESKRMGEAMREQPPERRWRSVVTVPVNAPGTVTFSFRNFVTTAG